MRTPLFSQQQPGGIHVFTEATRTTGSTFFVHSGTGTDGAGYGRNPDAPVATLDYAIGLCTAGKGDLIVVMPGHSETYSTTGTKVTIDIAGITILGLGTGSSRPTFTFSHTGATWVWSAAGVTLKNLLFVTGIDSVVTFATISGADATLEDIETRDTTDIEVIDAFTTTATADRLTVRRHFHNGYTGGDANVRVWKLVGCDRALFERCRFITKVTTAVINFVTTASTGVVVRDCDFLVTSTTNGSKNVVDTVSGSTWAFHDNFDLGAGKFYTGGSGGALANDTVASVLSAIGTLANTGGTATLAGIIGDVANVSIASYLAAIKAKTDLIT